MLFEMVAAQKLPASLRAALTYSIDVLALRRPFLHRVLNYEGDFEQMRFYKNFTERGITTGGCAQTALMTEGNFFQLVEAVANALKKLY